MQELYIVVSQYPFGFGEPFLEEEIKFLEKKFDSIYIVVSECNGLDIYNPQYYIPTNATIILTEPGLDISLKIKSIWFSLWDINFWEEIRYINKKYKISLTWVILKNIFAYFGKAYKFRKNLEPYLIKNPAATKTIYTYWCSEYTLAAIQLKKKYDSIRVVSRIHRWDIYTEFNPLQYLPLRNNIFDNIDTLYTISEHGKKIPRSQIP